MIEYNIVTICNKLYSPFLIKFVESAFKNLKNIPNVYIVDAGIEKDTKTYLIENYKQLNFVNLKNSNEYQSESTHDDGWKKTTYSKAKYLKDISISTKLPTFLIDNDSFFYEDFLDIIDFDSDIVACERTNKFKCTHIASFFGIINSKISDSFVEKWMHNLDKVKNNRGTFQTGSESPALSMTLSETNHRVQHIMDKIISCYDINNINNCRIYHSKSGKIANTIEKRLARYEARK